MSSAFATLLCTGPSKLRKDARNQYVLWQSAVIPHSLIDRLIYYPSSSILRLSARCEETHSHCIPFSTQFSPSLFSHFPHSPLFFLVFFLLLLSPPHTSNNFVAHSDPFHIHRFFLPPSLHLSPLLSPSLFRSPSLARCGMDRTASLRSRGGGWNGVKGGGGRVRGNTEAERETVMTTI